MILFCFVFSYDDPQEITHAEYGGNRGIAGLPLPLWTPSLSFGRFLSLAGSYGPFK